LKYKSTIILLKGFFMRKFVMLYFVLSALSVFASDTVQILRPCQAQMNRDVFTNFSRGKLKAIEYVTGLRCIPNESVQCQSITPSRVEQGKPPFPPGLGDHNHFVIDHLIDSSWKLKILRQGEEGSYEGIVYRCEA